MNKSSLYRLLSMIFLLAPLLWGCTALKNKMTEQSAIGITDLRSYRVEDRSGSLSVPVEDILIDDQSGEIEYIAIEAPWSGFDLDIRTAPYHSSQVILIPRRFANLESGSKLFKLQVGAKELTLAPRFNAPLDAFPGTWRDTIEQYWTSLNGRSE